MSARIRPARTEDAATLINFNAQALGECPRIPASAAMPATSFTFWDAYAVLLVLVLEKANVTAPPRSLR
jgi:hypothetical protein